MDRAGCLRGGARRAPAAAAAADGRASGGQRLRHRDRRRAGADRRRLGDPRVPQGLRGRAQAARLHRARHPPLPGHAHAPRPLHAGVGGRSRGRRARRARSRRQGHDGPDAQRRPQRGPEHGPAAGRRCRGARRGLAGDDARQASPRWTTTACPTSGSTATWSIDIGPRRLGAISTPGHTQGHYVFADEEASLLFAGDHVLSDHHALDRLRTGVRPAAVARLPLLAGQGARAARHEAAARRTAR